MHRSLTISVVIPCYNEEDGVREVIGRMPKAVDEVVVVDNNCTDRTAAVATSLGAKVVTEPTPGYGAAYKAGLKAATGDLVVTLDGDGTYPPEEIPGSSTPCSTATGSFSRRAAFRSATDARWGSATGSATGC